MLAGKRPFAGETVDRSARVGGEDEPKWSDCPVRVHRLLRGCLQKNPKDRLHDIADARLLLDDVTAEAASVSAPRRAVPWGGGGDFCVGRGRRAVGRLGGEPQPAPRADSHAGFTCRRT